MAKLNTMALGKCFLAVLTLSLIFLCENALAAASYEKSTASNVQPALDGLDAEIKEDMNVLQVPGAAVGIIVNDKVIFAKGYGVRLAGSKQAVDADTIFGIGSISKSFTTSAMATLVDEGKLDWDKPVREYLPWFQMYDPVATQLLTPRDLVTHRSGMASHDFLRYSTYLSPEELVHRIKYLEPGHTFRDTYDYNNVMLAVAGFLAGHEANSSWEKLVNQRIFLPLGMSRSTTAVEDTQKSDNFATPHLMEGNVVKPVDFYNYQKFGVAPAGAINTTVNDLLKYLQMHLADGKIQDKQIISAKQMKQLHTPVTVVPPSLKGPSNYALAWFITQHRGFSIINHHGSIHGFTAQAILIPERQIGIVVLNNLQSTLPETIGWSIADRLLGLSHLDYLTQFKNEKELRNKEKQKTKSQLVLEHLEGTKPSLDLSAYCGEYFHPAYGPIRVVQEGDGLSLKFDALKIALQHYGHDSFLSVSDELDGLLQFQLGSSGKVTQLILPLEPKVKAFVFQKR